MIYKYEHVCFISKNAHLYDIHTPALYVVDLSYKYGASWVTPKQKNKFQFI